MTDPAAERDLDEDILAIREMLAREQTVPLVSRRPEWGEVSQRPPSDSTPQDHPPLSPEAQARRARRKGAGLPQLPILPAAGDGPARNGGQAVARKPAPDDRPTGTQRHEEPAGRSALRLPDLAVLRGYRPRRRHILGLAVVLVVLLRPWLMVAVVLLPLITVLGLLIGLGHDRFWDGALRGFRWYAHRRPARAEALRRRIDRFAMRWDAVLDRFPAGTVDALYLPDLDSLQQRDAAHARALDERMTRLRQEADV